MPQAYETFPDPVLRRLFRTRAGAAPATQWCLRPRELPIPRVFRTLRSQYLLASLVVFATMLGLLLWNAQTLMHDTLRERVDGEREVVAPLLVAALGPLLAARDYATIDELVRDNADGGHLAFLELVDNRGRVVAAAGERPAPPKAVDTAPVRVAGQTLGEVRFALRTEALAAAQARLRGRSMAIGAGVLLAGMLVLTLAMRWLGRELDGLSSASRRIAGGDYAARLAGSRVHEIDQVARAFNQMAAAVESQLRALREQQAFTRGALETLSEGYLIVDRQGRAVDCNETFLRLNGLARPVDGQLDPTFTQVVLRRADGHVLQTHERPSQRVLADGLPQREQLLHIERPDGGRAWVLVNASPLGLGDDGRPSAAMSTLTDVTRHVEAEQALRAANEGLEQRVRERTAELERARDEAERASRAKSEFLSRMSHELRTPLNAILGFAQLLGLETQRLDAADLARLKQIESAGWHLLALINDVLDLSRIEAGALRTSSEPVQLRPLVLEVLAMVQAQADARRIELRQPLDGLQGGDWVLADRMRLKQVLSNLLTNAVKYNRDGGWVEVLVEPAADGQRAFVVRDNGRGFTPGQRERLYQPFTRFVPDGEVAEGTGIGLVITRRLVELMHGRIELETEAGVGSAFRIVLPAAEPPRPPGAAPRPLPAAPAAPLPAIAHTPLKLMAVEDNPSNVELLRQVLQRRPAWSLEVAGDGLEGLAVLIAGGFDGALLDIDLPGIDGIELCRRLRQAPSTAAMPLVALSANAMPADIRRAMAAGFDAYITKPVDVAALLDRLDQLLAAAHEGSGRF